MKKLNFNQALILKRFLTLIVSKYSKNFDMRADGL